jgi:hypothetical protein
MPSPYITPTDLLGNWTPSGGPGVPSDVAPLGIAWNTMSTGRLWEVCDVATARADNIVSYPLRASYKYEELTGPGHRVGRWGGSWRFVTSRKPILEVAFGQVSAAMLPYNWTAIPAANMAPETTIPTSLDGLYDVGGGIAAILISPGYAPWNGGRMSLRFGIGYVCGWPIAGLLPLATGEVTGSSGSSSLTVHGAAAGWIGAVITGTGIAADTVVMNVEGTTVTLSQATTAALSSTPVSIGYPPGSTTLNVDDVAGFTGALAKLYDGADTETVTVASVSAISSAVPAAVGPGTLTLASPGTAYPHMAPGITIQSMPQVIRWAAMLLAKSEALERGPTSTTVGSIPGRSTPGSKAIADAEERAAKLLSRFTRIY